MRVSVRSRYPRQVADQRNESQGFYEMLWDCDHCSTRGLLAKSQRHCPECGAKQNSDKRYFPKEGEAVRVDGHQYQGADRQCPACSAPQSARAHNCTNCGAALDGAQQVRALGAIPMAASKPVASVAKKRRGWVWLLVLAIVGAAGFGIWYRFIRKRSAQMTITAHSWERVIPVEEYRDLHESGWRDALPRDARITSCGLKQRSTKRVADGEECHNEKQDRGDGTFEVVKKCSPKYREEPVKDDWCNYRVLRWKEVPEAFVRAQGKGTTLVDPAGAPPAQVAETPGARRAGAMRETLTLELGKHKCEVSSATWRKYADGAAVKVLVRASSGEVVCSSL